MSFLTRHWELKLLALGFSIALWFFVMTSEKSDLILSAPIEFDGVAPGLVVAGERPDTIDVQLHGLRGTLARLGPDQVKARVSLAGVGPGEITLRIVPEQVMVPSGITVLRINPSRIRVVLTASSTPRESQAPRS
ncbi:MAG TPA: CdaR family protein [Methylomirabilota bacterium]|nr:CdaR family protein [Methylomirabilota bacterium]